MRAEYPLAIERLRGAIAAAEARGLLAGFAMQLRIGAGAYVCDEETALLHSIEGGRGTPRPGAARAEARAPAGRDPGPRGLEP